MSNLTPYRQIEGWFDEGEGHCLYNLTKELKDIKDAYCVEIGSWKGKSSAYLAHGCKENGEKLVCIDHFLGSSEHQDELQGNNTFSPFIANMKNFDFYESLVIMACRSEKAVEIWNKPIKLLFIDGEHTEDGVRKDFELFSPFIVSGGVASFHDLGRAPGIDKLVEELKAGPDYDFLGICGTVGMFKKV